MNLRGLCVLRHEMNPTPERIVLIVQTPHFGDARLQKASLRDGEVHEGGRNGHCALAEERSITCRKAPVLDSDTVLVC